MHEAVNHHPGMTDSRKRLFISGWAGFPELFPQISRNFTFVLPFGPEHEYFEQKYVNQHWDTIAGWSLGAHLCLKKLHELKTSHLILIAPFLDFCTYTPPEKVREMIAGLKRKPQALTRWFWKQCGITRTGIRIEHHQELLMGLEYLLDSSIKSLPEVTINSVTIMHGVRDRIVPARASEILLESIPGACYITLPYGHFIPEAEILQRIKTSN
ncbi:alpha/beta fold hydrolase [Desulfonatronovibrio magnus]|uniref:alpha/beta fold hydrolase n=1 Tax=Desulfonatronovibrio magnus TaxID=698827 RepID=UPI0005EB98A1|nr:hypothetical protein [Desulfonatronovibrio magnus]RQD55533.1 MAG: hypothetical protein D5R98_10540 [Desulfonatronovibrio sp. MSAO_Bac4]